MQLQPTTLRTHGSEAEEGFEQYQQGSEWFGIIDPDMNFDDGSGDLSLCLANSQPQFAFDSIGFDMEGGGVWSDTWGSV